MFLIIVTRCEKAKCWSKSRIEDQIVLLVRGRKLQDIAGEGADLLPDGGKEAFGFRDDQRADITHRFVERCRQQCAGGAEGRADFQRGRRGSVPAEFGKQPGKFSLEGARLPIRVDQAVDGDGVADCFPGFSGVVAHEYLFFMLR